MGHETYVDDTLNPKFLEFFIQVGLLKAIGKVFRDDNLSLQRLDCLWFRNLPNGRLNIIWCPFTSIMSNMDDRTLGLAEPLEQRLRFS
jgi:hypothetical protein